jgi:manganese oxidase
VNTPHPQLNTLLARALSRRSLLGMGALAGGAAILGRSYTAGAAQPAAEHTHDTRGAAPARPRTSQSSDPLIYPPSVDAQGRPYTDTHWDTPGEPGRDYTPVITPNGWTLPFRIVDGVKVFHLTAGEVPNHEFAPGLRAHCWGYNGSVHGPTIEAVEGDRVRIYVTNRLAAPTTVHWHGVLLPAGMDGVGGLNQPLIRPGETFKYEFTVRQHGTHMYHPHHDEMTQMSMGLMGLLIVHPRRPQAPRPDHDFAILLSEWHIPVGAARPNPNEMTDFNVLTFNARAFPGTAPLLARLNSRVRIRLGNLSAMSHHPLHLHGYRFWITETDGGSIPPSAWWPETTALVPVGSSRTIEFIADAPGDWAMHCHMTHHVMNQMGHDFPNMIGVDAGDLQDRVRRLLPGYMVMGQHGMDHGEHIEAGHMPVPENSIPMVGAHGPFDYITMGGMFTILKVREELPLDGSDPGWYDYPRSTVALHASPEDLRRDHIDPASPPFAPSAPARQPDAPGHDADGPHHEH